MNRQIFFLVFIVAIILQCNVYFRQWSRSDTVPLFPHVPRRLVKSHDCNLFFNNNKTAIADAVLEMRTHPAHSMTDEELLDFANCSSLKSRGYVTMVTEEEKEFPLAFSILLHKEAVQAEMLLRLIYRPQNFYCIHVDKKASNTTYLAMKAVVQCFPNVFLVRKRETVVYGGFARLQAELNCMEESLQRGTWMYYMNYASTMFPLKTNLELVRILKIYNGSNDINGVAPSPARYGYSFQVSKALDMQDTRKRKSPAPYQMNITKGSIYGVFSKPFVEFMLYDKIAKDLLEWSRDTYSPDEHFASTLHHIDRNKFLRSPGGYKGKTKGI